MDEDDPLIEREITGTSSKSREYASTKDLTTGRSSKKSSKKKAYAETKDQDDQAIVSDFASKGVLFGTSEDAAVWLNCSDPVGITFAVVVWIAVMYALACWIILYVGGDISLGVFIPVCVLIFMSLWAHLAVMIGDPGAVPWNAHPIEMDKSVGVKLQICGHCDSYKPPLAHHDRVSGRCISRMDHFCPWMNNAIGAGNQKNFLLFLIYTDVTSVFMYTVLAVHLIDDNLAFSGTGLSLSRGLIFVLLFAILFTSSMIVNQLYGIICGLGTIDRMKLKREESTYGTTIPWSHVFGDSWLAWFIPIAPTFARPDKVFRYKTKRYAYGRAV